MKTSFYYRAIFLTLAVLFIHEYAKSANFTYANGSSSVSIANNTGCAVTTYTFTQKTADNGDAKIAVGANISYTFPAGTNVSTATMAGSSFNGAAITTGWTISGQTISFQAPAAVGKKKTFTVVFANITNGNNISALNASTSHANTSSGINSYSGNSFAITTTACPTVPANNECTGSGGAFSLSVPAAGSSTCTTLSGTTFGATLSSQSSCSGAGGPDDDVW